MTIQALANDWRRRTMKHIAGQVHPAFHMDDVHRRVLDETLAEFELEVFSTVERDELWRTWHRLDAWPDFMPALAARRQRLPVVSFTMLPYRGRLRWPARARAGGVVTQEFSSPFPLV